ncbi:MAG: tryptophan synthase subunit beta, partial [Desulfuromonadaceae bacterium]
MTDIQMPDSNGFFGEYGGQEIPPELKQIMNDIYQAYMQIRESEAFVTELHELQRHYVGRPSPVYYCRRLSEYLGGA